VRNVSAPAPQPVPASFCTMLIRALTFFNVFVRCTSMYDLRLHQGIWGVPHVESLCRYISRPTVCLLRVCWGGKRKIRSYLDLVVISIFGNIHRAYRDRLPGLFHTKRVKKIWLLPSHKLFSFNCFVLNDSFSNIFVHQTKWQKKNHNTIFFLSCIANKK
jgi:hypothetical protein